MKLSTRFTIFRVRTAYKLRIFWRLTLPSWFCLHRHLEHQLDWTKEYDICKSCLKTLNIRRYKS